MHYSLLVSCSYGNARAPRLCDVVAGWFVLMAVLFVCALFVSPARVSAQIVSGVVRDGKGTPLEGARVALKNSPRFALANAEGRYVLKVSKSETGARALVVSYLNFAPVEKEISIPESGEARADIDFAEKGVVTERVLALSVRAVESAPVAQTTLSEAKLQETFFGQDAQYVLEKAVPSLISYTESGTSFSNYGSFRLRGIDQTRINVTLNGAPLNDMIDQGVFFSNMTDLGNSLRSVQVQRGVGVSGNGTASFGGSVAFESANLQRRSPAFEAQLSGGAFNLARASAEIWSGALAERFSFYAKYSAFSTDGYRSNTGTQSSSFFLSGAYFGENEILKLTAFNGRTQNKLGYLAVPKPLIDEDPRANINDENDRDDFGQQFVQLEYSRALSDDFTLAVSAYYGGAGGDFFVNFRESPADELTQINYPLRNDHLGVLASLEYAPAVSGLGAQFGVHAYTFQRKNWESLMPEYASSYYRDETDKNEASAFAKITFKEGAWLLYGDVQGRFAQMNFRPDERSAGIPRDIPAHAWFFVNPKLGVTFQASDAVSAYISFGRTGREPTRFDMLGSTQIVEGNLPILLRPNTVRPEFVNDWEGGVRVHLPGFRAQANGFYMLFQDEIAAIGEFIPQGFVQLRKNVPSSFRAGVELEAEAELGSDIGLSGMLTLMEARIAEYAPDNLGAGGEIYRNVRPVQTPNVMASLTARAQPIANLTLELSGRYVGESFLELTNFAEWILPAFAVADARLEWRFWGEHRLAFFAQNLFDARYFTNGGVVEWNGALAPAYFIQPPRNFSLALILKI
jgi:iron complex outermembrane receptor protein